MHIEKINDRLVRISDGLGNKNEISLETILDALAELNDFKMIPGLGSKIYGKMSESDNSLFSSRFVRTSIGYIPAVHVEIDNTITLRYDLNLEVIYSKIIDTLRNPRATFQRGVDDTEHEYLIFDIEERRKVFILIDKTQELMFIKFEGKDEFQRKLYFSNEQTDNIMLMAKAKFNMIYSP